MAETTSKRVAAIASRVLKSKGLFGRDIKALAASCLTQREPKKRKPKKA